MSVRKDIWEALGTLGIDTNCLDEKNSLGEDIGMDSQEIVEFQGLLSKSFNIKLPKNVFRKEMTLKEVQSCLEGYLCVEA